MTLLVMQVELDEESYYDPRSMEWSEDVCDEVYPPNIYYGIAELRADHYNLYTPRNLDGDGYAFKRIKVFK